MLTTPFLLFVKFNKVKQLINRKSGFRRNDTFRFSNENNTKFVIAKEETKNKKKIKKEKSQNWFSSQTGIIQWN